MKRTLMIIATTLLATPALASDVEGWSITYLKDSFSGAVSPFARVPQAGTGGILPGTVSYFCDGGRAVFTFVPSIHPLYSEDLRTQFKGQGSTIVTLTYGKESSASQAAQMRALFLKAPGEVAFKSSDGSTGTFPTVGADQVFPTIDARCTATK